MQLTSTLTLEAFDSLDELMAIPYPVDPRSEGERAYLDINVGLRSVEVHAAAPFGVWRSITDEDTRFEIAGDTTGVALANALADSDVLAAMDRVVSPPPTNLKLTKAQLALVTGRESFELAVHALIEALAKHITVVRPAPAAPATASQSSLF